MGFCGFPERNLFNPSLSTVDLMYEEHGKEAFKLIMNSDKWYENDKDAPEIVMPYKLMEEESTRPERVALTERR
jgi:DNA-binding LacI/PurR family transcriptional regulator